MVPTMNTYRLAMKRRLYIRCVRSYPELFAGKKDEIAPEHGAVLQEKYLWNDLMEEDQFCRLSGEGDMPMQTGGGLDPNSDQMKQLTAEGAKIQLRDMFKATIDMFDGVKAKVQLLQQ